MNQILAQISVSPAIEEWLKTLQTPLGALAVGLILWLIKHFVDDVKAANSKRKQLANLLYHVTNDSIKLLQRFVQYVGQGIEGSLSFSKLSTMVTPDQVTELIKLGASAGVIKGIGDVQTLYADVKAQVDRAQEEYSTVTTSTVQTLGPLQHCHMTFARASAFVLGEWTQVASGVDAMIAATKDAGLDVSDLRKRYDDILAQYREAGKTLQTTSSSTAEAVILPEPLEVKPLVIQKGEVRPASSGA